MTDKERLEDIRAEVEQMSYMSPLNFEKTRIKKESALWLMEKLEELKLEINDLRAEVQKWQKFYEESEESHLETKELLYSTISENKRYKQALEYIQRAIYTQHCTKNHKWNTEFEKGQISGLIQASNIVEKAIKRVEEEK